MPKLIFLKFDEQDDSVNWLDISNEGLITGPFSAKSAELKNKFVDSEIVLLVSGLDVLLTQVILPKLSQSKIKQAISFALEEQLSEDIKNLHFSQGKRTSNQEIPVAIVNAERMRNWLNQAKQFTNSEANVAAIVSDSLLIPFTENAWTLWMEQDRVLIRSDKHLGFSCDPESLLEMLKLKLDQASKKPEKFMVYANNDQQLSDLLKELGLPIDFITLDDNALKLQFDEYKKYNHINMLQDEFKPKHEIFTTEVTGLVIAGLLGLWFAVLVFGNAAKYVYLNHQVNKIDQQIAQNYKTLFPTSTSVVSPRLRVQRLLSSMRTSQTKGAFLNMVAIVGPIVKQQKGLVVQMVTYADSKAQLHVDVPDFAILDNFTQGLRSAGLVVRNSNATKEGTTIRAKIELSMAG